MRAGKWEFTPTLWPSLAAGVMLAVLVSLGMWQLDRAEQKRVMHERFMRLQAAGGVDLNSNKDARTDKPAMLWRNIEAIGTFSSETQILLDSQVAKGEPGYRVFTPFKLSGEDIWLLVDRGWVAAGTDRDIAPEVGTGKGETRITGMAVEVPWTGIVLSEPTTERLDDHVFRVPHIDLHEIAGVTKRELLPYVFKLQPGSAEGFYIRWHRPGSGEARHLGYAFQWFALAATLTAIYLVVNSKKAS